jgi:hypothetical protein
MLLCWFESCGALSNYDPANWGVDMAGTSHSEMRKRFSPRTNEIATRPLKILELNRTIICARVRRI